MYKVYEEFYIDLFLFPFIGCAPPIFARHADATPRADSYPVCAGVIELILVLSHKPNKIKHII